MTPDQYQPEEKSDSNEKVFQQIRRSIHSIENKLEHLAEKLELCLETFVEKDENGLAETDLFGEDYDAKDEYE
ncbi:MAG: hypothetical protein WC975_15550 [Phycisphaerae bacterium]